MRCDGRKGVWQPGRDGKGKVRVLAMQIADQLGHFIALGADVSHSLASVAFASIHPQFTGHSHSNEPPHGCIPWHTLPVADRHCLFFPILLIPTVLNLWNYVAEGWDVFELLQAYAAVHNTCSAMLLYIQTLDR